MRCVFLVLAFSSKPIITSHSITNFEKNRAPRVWSLCSHSTCLQTYKYIDVMMFTYTQLCIYMSYTLLFVHNYSTNISLTNIVFFSPIQAYLVYQATGLPDANAEDRYLSHKKFCLHVCTCNLTSVSYEDLDNTQKNLSVLLSACGITSVRLIPKIVQH